MPFSKDTIVQHPRFGRGQVRMDDGVSVLVRFDHGVEECLPADLVAMDGVEQKAAKGEIDSPLNTIVRILGHCIASVNDAWGVFSCSRVELVPHQLWVCKRVLETWPPRWLIADDVGLGKTIEAGLILTPLLASGRVRRLLILTPANITEQWQVRLRELFDIRIPVYSSEIDTDKSDYWNTHDRVIASAHTLRLDTAGRWDRLIAAKPWDLVLIDEAHHLNVNDTGNKTLAYELAERLQRAGRLQGMIFFTGTPHRGKDIGFLSLLKLLRPDEFNPYLPFEAQAQKLRDVMIRNNKQRVTDMRGNPLFTPVHSRQETYAYSPEETCFYDKLTEFILSGKAYASGLTVQQRRIALLVLVTMQKLASSSVAAVRRALSKRLERLKEAKQQHEKYAPDIKRLQELYDGDDPSNTDEIAMLEERVMDNCGSMFKLNPNEIPALEELLEAANAIDDETKIRKIVDLVASDFSARSVLFFTEYKATQALLINALQDKFGGGCVAFINGDGFLEGIRDNYNCVGTIKANRYEAANRFNRGDVRFLVSTEAAGEGIDLQESCHTLIHVDLPWNPMRLHQRVGRVSRYGQKHPVDVISIRNPDTIESLIWQCLDSKLDRIMLAFQGSMDDPEDMRQLIIGMASPRMFTKVFADADPSLRGERLDQWFDQQTATFGGENAVSVVKKMFGSVARFDFGEVADEIPKVDLPDLMPFFKALLTVLGKRPNQESSIRLNFTTPHAWRDNFTISDRYNLLFARDIKKEEDEDIAGIGLNVVNNAIRTAISLKDSLAVVKGCTAPYYIFSIRDRITDRESGVRALVVGVKQNSHDSFEIVKDWHLIKELNIIINKPRSLFHGAQLYPEVKFTKVLREAQSFLEAHLQELDIMFDVPSLEIIGWLQPPISENNVEQASRL